MGAMAGAGLVLPLGALSLPVARMVASASIRSPSVDPFMAPLPVPPVLEPVRKDGGTDHYEVTQRAAMQEILPDLKTEVWGYEGVFTGPTVEARSGRPVVIRQTNVLPVPVTTHLHGGVTPPESDGYPTDLILPSDHDHPSHAQADPHGGDVPGGGRHPGRKDYRYPNEQRAATLCLRAPPAAGGGPRRRGDGDRGRADGPAGEAEKVRPAEKAQAARSVGYA